MFNTKIKKKDFFANVVTFLYWLVIALVIFFAYMNIEPYAIVVKAITTNSVFGLLPLLLNLPLIGAIVGLFVHGFNWIVGTIIWAVLQTLQLFPIFIRRNKNFVQTVIKECDSHAKYKIKEDDDPALAALKRWYNKFPALTITRARRNCLFAYAIDFCICLMVYPPVKGSLTKAFFILTTGQFNKIDWGNVVMLCLTIYIVELCVKFLFWLNDIILYLKLSRNS